MREHKIWYPRPWTKTIVERVYRQATDPADRATADLVGEMLCPSWAA
jgi:hypothetical protein